MHQAQSPLTNVRAILVSVPTCPYDGVNSLYISMHHLRSHGCFACLRGIIGKVLIHVRSYLGYLALQTSA